MSKIQLLIYIPDDLDRKFREFLALKYKHVEKGLISGEVERALRYWINLHTKAQKTLLESKAPNPTPKISRVFAEIKRYLLSKYYDELSEGTIVPDTHLREAIAATRGSDKRTIRKWLRVFEQFKLIKRLSLATWELL
ncbi:MAG: hypothetical protein ACTSX6_10585 [Candidatus Heimdallarchaeaceae archaeon]